MRTLLACVLLIAAAGAGLASYGALSNLWADYQDNPPGSYLLFGLPWLALALGLAAAAVRILYKR